MSGTKKKRRKKIPKKEQQKRTRERAETMAVKTDMKQASDPGWGTSPGSLGRIKAESEESRLITCPECGFSRGRHMIGCPAKP